MKTTAYFLRAFILLFLTLGCSVSLLAQHRASSLYRSNAPVETKRYGSAINEQIVRGDRYMARGQFELALIAYDLAITQNPAFAESYMKRAMAKLRMGDAFSAQQDYNLAIRLNPYVGDLYGYGDPMRKSSVMAVEEDFLDQLRTHQDIFANLQEVDAALNSFEGRRDAKLYKYRGNLLVLLGHYFEAAEDYSQAIQLNPDYAEAYYNRGIAHILAYNRPDACFDLERSAQLGYNRGLLKMEYFCAF
jgi:tetratricopeptide (TPR) repeat protein